jgi:Myb-like DNA-binding domain
MKSIFTVNNEDQNSNLYVQTEVVWIPCIPDYVNGIYVPLYNLSGACTRPASIENKNLISRGAVRSTSWNCEEDRILTELIKENGAKNWVDIAEKLKSLVTNSNIKKAKQCRERWFNKLNPEINRGEWSFDEDLLLLTHQKALGNQWSLISKMLKGRTENSVKNRWNLLIKNAGKMMNLSNSFSDYISEVLIKELSKNKLEIKRVDD